jgi:hypothetical protein
VVAPLLLGFVSSCFFSGCEGAAMAHATAVAPDGVETRSLLMQAFLLSTGFVSAGV